MDLDLIYIPSKEDIEEEIMLGEMELIAQLVQAEAGNQDLMGMRYVVDVVLNRVDSEDFPNSVEEVIFQKNAFSVMDDGGFDRAAWNMSEEAYEAVKLEYESRSDYNILYFGLDKTKFASHHFKHQDHWFSY